MTYEEIMQMIVNACQSVDMSIIGEDISCKIIHDSTLLYLAQMQQKGDIE